MGEKRLQSRCVTVETARILSSIVYALIHPTILSQIERLASHAVETPKLIQNTEPSSKYRTSVPMEENMNSNNDDNLFMMKIHQKISAAIGGYNANQFLCLQIPGTILYADDYKYDIEHNGEKGAVVEANESKLANKMFDPCYLTGSDNGFSLPYQYKSALDILTPKINKDVADYKNELRQLLMSEYPYDFGDGEKSFTLQEVYFRLYEEYIDELDKWAALQTEKKEELKRFYKTADEYNAKYLEWYELIAEKCLNEINEKKSRILAVFSPNDMKILEGVLDSGCGAELQEARQMVNNARKFTPNGGNVYPVRFVPENWFKLLGSSFTSADTMKSPEAIASDLQNLSIRRMQLCFYIVELSSIVSSKIDGSTNETVSLLKTNVSDLKRSSTKFKSLYAESLQKYTELSITEREFLIKNENSFKDVLYAYLDSYDYLIFEDKRKCILTNLVKKTFRNAMDINVAELILKFFRRYIPIFKIDRSALLEKCDVVIEKLQDLFKTPNNYPQKILYLKKMLTPVIEQYVQISEKIDKSQENLLMSTSLDSERSTSEFDMEIPKGYTQVSIVFNEDDLKKIENSESTSAHFRTGNFRFLSKRTKVTSNFHSENSSSESKHEFKEIRISMNVAKVGIERDWFNPGIFALTKDMVKLGKSMISPNKDYGEITNHRLKDMKDCIFPCYPVAMVIARDIKLVFTYTNSENAQSEFVQMEKQSLSGGGLLMFRGANENTSAKGSCLHVFKKDNSVVVNIDSTQLLGYYLETTHADKSTIFGSEDDSNLDDGPFLDGGLDDGEDPAIGCFEESSAASANTNTPSDSSNSVAIADSSSTNSTASAKKNSSNPTITNPQTANATPQVTAVSEKTSTSVSTASMSAKVNATQASSVLTADITSAIEKAKKLVDEVSQEPTGNILLDSPSQVSSRTATANTSCVRPDVAISRSDRPAIMSGVRRGAVIDAPIKKEDERLARLDVRRESIRRMNTTTNAESAKVETPKRPETILSMTSPLKQLLQKRKRK